jgi:thiamine-monophosphate kinase
LSSPGSNGPGPVSALGERALIERIRARLPQAPASLLVPIGDDAAVAVADRGALQVLTTDALVEGVHFDRRFSSPFDIGYKALAVNVSDVASMGGAPRFALLSLMLPDGIDVRVVDGILDGLCEMAAASGVTLAGGNITRTPSSVSGGVQGQGPLVVDVSLVGSVRPRKVLTRGAGRPGDWLYVTGTIGGAAAGLGWLRSRVEDVPQGDRADGPWLELEALPAPDDPDMRECVVRHRRPEPRARLGAILGRNRAAGACMDLSDGLADAVAQVAAASGTGAVIDASALPVHPGARAWFMSRGADPIVEALGGGDDYELLFSSSKRRSGRLRSAISAGRGVPVTRIGELTADRSIVLLRDGVAGPLPAGFVHF